MRHYKDSQPYDPDIHGFVFFKNSPRKTRAWKFALAGIALGLADIAVLLKIAPSASVGELFVVSAAYLLAGCFVGESIRQAIKQAKAIK